MYRQPSTTSQNSTPKREGQIPESISQEVIYHGTLARTSSRYQSLRSCSGNRAKMLLKGHLGIKCHSQYNKVPPIVNGGDRGCLVRDLESITILVLHSISFPKGHTTHFSATVTDHRLCYYNSNAWGWHNRYQSGVISITDLLILQNGKKL